MFTAEQQEYINKALGVRSFNISKNDFKFTKRKEEIRHVFQSQYFPGFDSSILSDDIDIGYLNSVIKKLKTYQSFDNLFKYEGFGPGEVLLYFLVDSAELQGQNSAGKDVRARGGMYEVKAPKISSDKKFAYDMRFGGTINTADLFMELRKLASKFSINDFGAPSIKVIKSRANDEFTDIQNRFAKRVYKDYFAGHQTIIFNNNDSKSDVGYVQSIKQIKQEDIEIYRYTQNNFKLSIHL